MKKSTRLLWLLSIIVLVAAVSKAVAEVDNDDDDDNTSLEGMTTAKRETLEVEDHTSLEGMVKREALEVKPPKAGKGKGKGKGRGTVAAGPEMNWPGQWELFMKNSGVSAMHAILMPLINKVQFYDATIWRISQIKLPPGVPCHVFDAKKNKVDCWAHSVLVDINTGDIKPLAVTKLLIITPSVPFLYNVLVKITQIKKLQI